MNLFEEFLSKMSDRVNWSTLGNSAQLDYLVGQYKGKAGNLTKEYVHSIRMNFQNEIDLHKTYHSSVVTDIRAFYEDGGKSLEELMDYTQMRLGPEDTYVRMREIHADLKTRITASGEMPDVFEKDMLNTIEKQLLKMTISIPNADALWEKYKATNEAMTRNIESLPSVTEVGGSSGLGTSGNAPLDTSYASVEQYGADSWDSKNGKLYRPTQTDYQWGQGNSEDLLGIRATNNTFSGTDMVATINIPGREPIIFGELSQISYSTYREKVPVRSLGRITPKGYTRGYRTITGVLVFNVFDRSIVYECMREIHANGYRMLMDEMPVFDVTITMSNEFGHKSAMTIYGISTYSEGQMMGVDMIGIQNAYEFYAIDIEPMHSLEDGNVLKGSSVIDRNGNIVRLGTKDEEISYYKEAYNYSLTQQSAIDESNKFRFERN